MADVNDMDLVCEYASRNSEPAFAELVRRHINLVYSVAFRFTGHPQDAQDVTQAVFIILAQKAGGLRAKTILTGWLYETTRFTAMRFMRTKASRRLREREAYMSTLNDSNSESVWRRLAPLLEEAMARLSENERTLVALRFFENKSAAETATLLGIQEWAARKRVERAMEKLRLFFMKRGAVVSVAAMTAAISANSVQAAPVMLAKTATAVALTKGVTASVSTLVLVKGAIKFMAWTKIKTTILVGACVLLTAGTTTVIIVSHRARPVQGIPKDWSVLRGDADQWKWANGKINGHDTGGDSLLASGREYGDVTVSATVSSTNREASLGIRLRDADNGYIIVFAPRGTLRDDAGHMALVRRIGGEETTLASYNGHVFSYIGQTANIKVMARGPVIEVQLNGNRVMRVMDTTFARGLVGLRIFGDEEYPCDATFSNLTIR